MVASCPCAPASTQSSPSVAHPVKLFLTDTSRHVLDCASNDAALACIQMVTVEASCVSGAKVCTTLTTSIQAGMPLIPALCYMLAHCTLVCAMSVQKIRPLSKQPGRPCHPWDADGILAPSTDYIRIRVGLMQTRLVYLPLACWGKACSGMGGSLAGCCWTMSPCSGSLEPDFSVMMWAAD